MPRVVEYGRSTNEAIGTSVVEAEQAGRMSGRGSGSNRRRRRIALAVGLVVVIGLLVSRIGCGAVPTSPPPAAETAVEDEDRVDTAALAEVEDEAATEPPPDDDGDVEAEPPPRDARDPPIDPAALAPAVHTGVGATLFAATAFLHEGDDGLQVGVETGALEPHRAAVLRGRVLDTAEAPLAGVEVRVVGRAEFGRTTTRDDGRFDLVVNGGSVLTVSFERDGSPSASRRVAVPWQDYVNVADVILVERDERSTTLEFGTGRAQVHEATPVRDADGARAARLLMPAATGGAVATLPDGSTRALERVTVRATEYTVGEAGRRAMPADLPANVAYTYAVEFTVDEAEALGARRVDFDAPLVSYVDDFLGFGAGERVPVAYLDRDTGVWVPERDGVVVTLLDVDGEGRARLDATGDGVPSSAGVLAELGIDDDERAALADSFAPGATFWRVVVPHFSAWDYNWPFGLPDGATAPGQAEPEVDRGTEHACTAAGSTIECQNQVVRLTVDVLGAGTSLNASSRRAPVRGRTITVPLTGPQPPEPLERVDLEIEVAGQHHAFAFEPGPDLEHAFTWDGLDAYGREVVRGVIARVRLGYTYRGVFGRAADTAASFGQFPSDLTGNRTREEITVWQSWDLPITTWDPRGLGLGGWTLAEHHFFDAVTGTLHLGDGTQRAAAGMAVAITTLAGTGATGDAGDDGPADLARLWNPSAVAAAADGSVYVADTNNHRVRRIDRDGTITTVAGVGRRGTAGDGGRAVDAELWSPVALAFAPDGGWYVVERDAHRVRRIDPGGVITTVAGTGEAGFSGDGGPATAARLSAPTGVAVADDGAIYVSDTRNHRVRRIGPDGVIATVVGTGEAARAGPGRHATDVHVGSPVGIAFASDGGFYVASSGGHRVLHVDVAGTVTAAVGTGIAGFRGDGGPAAEARITSVSALAVGPDGALYVLERTGHRVRRVDGDGIITTVAGSGRAGTGGDGGAATEAELALPLGLAVSPDGSLLIADSRNHRVRRVASPLGGLRGDTLLPSEDANELYVFGEDGRHLRTLHPNTAATLRTFDYDDAGRLVAVTDAAGSVTRVEHDPDAHAATIVAPGGARHELRLDEAGFLVGDVDALGGARTYDVDPGGLVTSRSGPDDAVWRYAFDAAGRLVRAEDPAGGVQTFERSHHAHGFEVRRTTALGRVTTYTVEWPPGGGERLHVRLPDGRTSDLHVAAAGITATRSDGSTVTVVHGPDPRFGMLAPVPTRAVHRTPAGREAVLEETREAVLADRLDPLSLATLTITWRTEGHVWTSTFDRDAATITTTSPEGRVRTVGVDEAWRVVRDHTEALAEVVYEYDAHGRVTRIRQGDGDEARDASFEREPGAITLVDALGHRSTLRHDEVGRVSAAIAPDGGEATFSYDHDGRLGTLTPPDGEAHAFGYTPLGQVATYRPPTGGDDEDATVSYTYDLDRAIVRTTMPGVGDVERHYDAGGRMVAVRAPDGERRYHHDDAGRVVAIETDDVLVRDDLDGALPTGSSWTGAVAGTVRFEFDDALRPTARIVGTAAPLALRYDADGLPLAAGPLAIRRDTRHGLPTGLELAAAVETIAYDHHGAMDTIRVGVDGAETYALDLERDALGRVVRRTERVADAPAVTHAYVYDAVGRLVEERVDGALAARYDYDRNGNRVRVETPDEVREVGVDARDRLDRDGATTFTYRPDGHRIAAARDGAETTYDYDAFGALRAVQLGDGTDVAYVVDGRGRRVGRAVDGAAVQGYLYDGVRLVAELDAAGEVVGEFVYGTRPHVPEAMLRHGRWYRLVLDHLGSVQLVVDAETGEVAQRLRYDAFGRVLLDTAPGFQPFGFAGGLFDPATGLVRFGARDYDPLSGRWTASDPVLFAGGDANLYAYAGNDPVNRIDPSGQTPVAPPPGYQHAGREVVENFVFKHTTVPESIYRMQEQGGDVVIILRSETVYEDVTMPDGSTGQRIVHDRIETDWFIPAFDCV